MKIFGNRFFKKKIRLEQEIEAYLCCIANVDSAFNTGVKSYLKGEQAAFEECKQATSEGERKADQCLKNIKYNLYANTLYPEFQKDITLIFDRMDNVADISNQVLVQISLETPSIPDYIKPYFVDLVDYASKTTNEIVNASRHLFRNRVMIEDHANKVSFYQNEASKTVEKILEQVYCDDNISELAYKRHIAYFAMKILSVSENAITVSKKLVFYMIKSD
jgi:hypothetical protein